MVASIGGFLHVLDATGQTAMIIRIAKSIVKDLSFDGQMIRAIDT